MATDTANTIAEMIAKTLIAFGQLRPHKKINWQATRVEYVDRKWKMEIEPISTDRWLRYFRKWFCISKAVFNPYKMDSAQAEKD